MGKVIALVRGYFNHELSGFIIIGILLRMVLMPYFISPYDISAYHSSLVKFMNSYSPYTLFSSIYPPFIYFLLFPLFSIAFRIGFLFKSCYVPEAAYVGTITGLVSPDQVDTSFLFLWKFPSLCFDLLTGLLIYEFVKKLTQDSSVAKNGFTIWFFNPFTLIVSYIHGSYDVIVAFLILLGVFLLYNANYFSAGLSFGLGALTKLSPIYVSFPLAFFILFKGVLPRFNPRRFKENVLSFVKFSIGCTTPILFFIPLVSEYFYLMYMSVTEEVLITGGLNQWFFAAVPHFSYLVNSKIETIQEVFSYFPIICLIPYVFLYKVLERDNKKYYEFLLITIFFIELIYLFLPVTVQPQYLLWILPLLVVISAMRKRFLFPLSIFSIAASAFFFSIQGPHTFLYPLAMHTSVYSLAELRKNIINFMSLQGVISEFLRQDLCLLFGGIAFFGHLVAIFMVIKELVMVTKNDKK